LEHPCSSQAPCSTRPNTFPTCPSQTLSALPLLPLILLHHSSSSLPGLLLALQLLLLLLLLLLGVT
jgi:hypothetical protein